LISPSVLAYRVLVERPKGKADRYGGTANDWTDPQRWDFPCWFEPQATERNGELSSRTWLLMVPGAVDLGLADRLTIDGVRYRLSRPAIVRRTPAGVSHVEAELVSYEGAPRV
jgi:hypothetical protein